MHECGDQTFYFMKEYTLNKFKDIVYFNFIVHQHLLRITSMLGCQVQYVILWEDQREFHRQNQIWYLV